MKAYKDMSREELMLEKETLEKRIEGFRAMNLSLDMTRGKPSTAQLDMHAKMFDGLDKTGFKSVDGDCRNYGIPNGITEVRELFAQILDTDKDKVLVGNGSSLNLMFDALMRAVVFGEHDSDKPWSQVQNKKWLCPVPGYDRHFSVTEKLGFELICVPLKDDGPDMDIVEELVKDDSVKGMWAIPCYSNPDGIVYSQEVCERLASMKTAAKDFRIFWDNAYVVHHLYEDESLHATIPDILSLCEKAGNPSRVYEFASTSKITFAGSGLSVICANKENLDFAKKIIGVQTIGANKINQLAHINYIPDMATLKALMNRHADILRPKFEKTLEVLDREITGTGIASWRKPYGGYFISVFVYPGTADKVVSMSKELGVAFTPAGATYPYKKDPDNSNIRLSPSFPTVEDINKAVEVFAVCAKLTAIEKILEA